MRCALCDADTRVIDCRPAPGNVFRRRRKCLGCGHRFNTYESTVNQTKMVEQRRASFRQYVAKMTPEQRAAWNKRRKLRQDARREAKRTGEPVEAIYQRWDVG